MTEYNTTDDLTEQDTLRDQLDTLGTALAETLASTGTALPNVEVTKPVANPDALVATLDMNQVEESQLQQYLLPSRTEPQFALSGLQVRVLLRYLLEHSEFHQMTFARAITELRKRANIRGESRDFGMVQWVMQQGYAQNASNPLSPRQHELRIQFIQALSGKQDHWHPPINAAIREMENLDRAIIADHLRDWIKCRTQGDFDLAFNTFKALFGDIPRRSDRERNAAGESTGQPGEIGHLDPVTGAHDNEPF